jgi:hypothetical protein
MERVERERVHPQALVILWRVVTAPPRLDVEGDRLAGEELRRRLHAASALIASVDSRDGSGTAVETEPVAR